MTGAGYIVAEKAEKSMASGKQKKRPVRGVFFV
jgi:hypothetical protein